MKAGRSFRGLVLVLALALIVGVAGGATFAWLTAKTDPVVNTFTYGDITSVSWCTPRGASPPTARPWRSLSPKEPSAL